MTSYLIEVRDDLGGAPLQIRVPATPGTLSPALQLAVEIMKTLPHHPPSSGHTLTLRVSP